MQLTPEQERVKAWLDAVPGAVGTPTGYKVMGKTFAILSIRRRDGCGWLILKSDPHLAEILREQYSGVGHRSHLDRRYWIAITLGADVPDDEIERLIAQSYDLVCAGLTRKQRVELAALDGQPE
jgi:predicted DNA-binding protein (MmcQ/YjbR family)